MIDVSMQASRIANVFPKRSADCNGDRYCLAEIHEETAFSWSEAPVLHDILRLSIRGMTNSESERIWMTGVRIRIPSPTLRWIDAKSQTPPNSANSPAKSGKELA